MESTASQLLRSAPYFPVADVESSAHYYARVLGFGIDYAPGTPPQFAIVSRDGLAVMLRKVPNPALISPAEKQGGTWDAFFWVRDADALFAELHAKGADVVYEPIVREYRCARIRRSRQRRARPRVWPGRQPRTANRLTETRYETSLVDRRRLCAVVLRVRCIRRYLSAPACRRRLPLRVPPRDIRRATLRSSATPRSISSWFATTSAKSPWIWRMRTAERA